MPVASPEMHMVERTVMYDESVECEVEIEGLNQDAIDAELARDIDFEDSSLSGAQSYIYKDGELYSVATDESGNRTLQANSTYLTGDMLTAHMEAMSAIGSGSTTHELAPVLFDENEQFATYSVMTYEVVEGSRVQISNRTELVTKDKTPKESSSFLTDTRNDSDYYFNAAPGLAEIAPGPLEMKTVPAPPQTAKPVAAQNTPPKPRWWESAPVSDAPTVQASEPRVIDASAAVKSTQTVESPSNILNSRENEIAARSRIETSVTEQPRETAEITPKSASEIGLTEVTARPEPITDEDPDGGDVLETDTNNLLDASEVHTQGDEAYLAESNLRESTATSAPSVLTRHTASREAHIQNDTEANANDEAIETAPKVATNEQAVAAEPAVVASRPESQTTSLHSQDIQPASAREPIVREANDQSARIEASKSATTRVEATDVYIAPEPTHRVESASTSESLASTDHIVEATPATVERNLATPVSTEVSPVASANETTTVQFEDEQIIDFEITETPTMQTTRKTHTNYVSDTPRVVSKVIDAEAVDQDMANHVDVAPIPELKTVITQPHMGEEALDFSAHIDHSTVDDSLSIDNETITITFEALENCTHTPRHFRKIKTTTV